MFHTFCVRFQTFLSLFALFTNFEAQSTLKLMKMGMNMHVDSYGLAESHVKTRHFPPSSFVIVSIVRGTISIVIGISSGLIHSLLVYIPSPALRAIPTCPDGGLTGQAMTKALWETLSVLRHMAVLAA